MWQSFYTELLFHSEICIISSCSKHFCHRVIICFSDGSRSKVANLFHEVEQINRAVGTLVTIMTDEENSGNEEELPRTKRGKPVMPY